MSDSMQPLNKSSQVFTKELQDQAFHSDEVNAVCQKLWAASLLSPQLRRSNEKKKMVIACLKREASSWPLLIREPTNHGFYLGEVWDGFGEE